MKKEDIITYDLKIVNSSGKYFFLADNIDSIEDAESFIKNIKPILKDKDLEAIQIWRTKNNISTSLIRDELIY